MNRISVLLWLQVCTLLIVSMILLGGYTRLTSSGLSIVEWKPITGTIPPISEVQWQEEFIKYKDTPEYKTVNWGMSLQEFKFIYLVEYFHRLLGRVLGIFFTSFMIFFYVKKKIDSPIYLVMLILGGFQGFIGWYMVKSGLVNLPSVSHYRLGAHFMLAICLYSMMLWQIFKITGVQKTGVSLKIKKLLILFTSLLIVQMFLGSLAAGLKSGLTYNSFPLMGNSFIPDEVVHLGMNLKIFDDPSSLHFIHRLCAYIVAVVCLFLSTRLYILNRSFAIMLILALALQIFLGILVVLFKVPIWIAIGHQLGSIILLSIALFGLYRFI